MIEAEVKKLNYEIMLFTEREQNQTYAFLAKLGRGTPTEMRNSEGEDVAGGETGSWRKTTDLPSPPSSSLSSRSAVDPPPLPLPRNTTPPPPPPQDLLHSEELSSADLHSEPTTSHSPYPLSYSPQLPQTYKRPSSATFQQPAGNHAYPPSAYKPHAPTPPPYSYMPQASIPPPTKFTNPLNKLRTTSQPPAQTTYSPNPYPSTYLQPPTYAQQAPYNQVSVLHDEIDRLQQRIMDRLHSPFTG